MVLNRLVGEIAFVKYAGVIRAFDTGQSIFLDEFFRYKTFKDTLFKNMVAIANVRHLQVFNIISGDLISYI